jgi:hypothetical protein
MFRSRLVIIRQSLHENVTRYGLFTDMDPDWRFINFRLV